MSQTITLNNENNFEYSLEVINKMINIYSLNFFTINKNNSEDLQTPYEVIPTYLSIKIKNNNEPLILFENRKFNSQRIALKKETFLFVEKNDEVLNYLKTNQILITLKYYPDNNSRNNLDSNINPYKNNIKLFDYEESENDEEDEDFEEGEVEGSDSEGKSNESLENDEDDFSEENILEELINETNDINEDINLTQNDIDDVNNNLRENNSIVWNSNNNHSNNNIMTEPPKRGYMLRRKRVNNQSLKLD